MKRSSLLATLTLLAAPLLVSGERRGTEITFGVESGSTLTKTFEVVEEKTLDHSDMTVNGQAPPVMPEMELTTRRVKTMEIEDTYSKVTDGRPAMLMRSFDTLSGESEVGMEVEVPGVEEAQRNDDLSMERHSVLDGESVEFIWNEEEETHDVVLPEGSSLEKKDVEGLLEDMDYRTLLPAGAVDEGDEWTVELRHMQKIFAPGGNTQLISDIPEGMGELGSMADDVGHHYDYFNEDVEGEFTATFDSMQELDDGEIAVIKFTFELTNAMDLTDQNRESMEDLELPEGVSIEIEHMDVEIVYEGEGILTWDLKAGHFHTFEATGDFELLMDQGSLFEAMGREMSMEQTLEFSGSITYDVSAE